MVLCAKDIMWQAPPLLSPDDTLKKAAAKMIEVNAGILPVGRNGKIEGMITDRDIVVRAVADGKAPEQSKVSDFMTRNPFSCREGDSIAAAAEIMKRKNVSRLAVMNDQNNFTGILSFGHIFRNDANAEEAADMISRVAGRQAMKRKKAS